MNVIQCFKSCNRLTNKIIFSINGQKMQFSSQSKVKTIEFKTCGPLYEKLRQKHRFLYGNSPSDGLPVSIEYVDTFDGNPTKANTKTVVAIHGNPGNHTHFSGLIDYFGKSDSNVRVIVPNLPDFNLTRKTMAFWHSNQERVQLIRDFLKALNVSEIDCLISHSAGIHPVSQIWADSRELTIKGIGIFCPQYTYQRFFSRIYYASFLAKSKLGIKLMDYMRPDLLLRGRFPMTFANVDEFLYFLVVHSTLNISDVHKRIDILRSKQLPTLLVYGENDKLIKKENFERLSARIGVDQNDVVVYSNDKSLEKDSEQQNWIKVLALRGGGHFAYVKYNEEVIKHLSDHILS